MPLLRSLPPRPCRAPCRPAYPAILGAIVAACHRGVEPPSPALAATVAIAIAPLDAAAPEDAPSIDARCDPSDAGIADAEGRARAAHRRVPRPQLEPAGY